MTKYKLGEAYEVLRDTSNFQKGELVEVVTISSTHHRVTVTPPDRAFSPRVSLHFSVADTLLRKVGTLSTFKEGWIIGVREEYGPFLDGQLYQVLKPTSDTQLRFQVLSKDKDIFSVSHELADRIFFLFSKPFPKEEKVNYYKLPNGIEVKEVSRYLTSNSAQAVQYLSRSSRIDGIRKGSAEDQLSDLRKAIDFIEDEITRLTKLQEEK